MKAIVLERFFLEQFTSREKEGESFDIFRRLNFFLYLSIAFATVLSKFWEKKGNFLVSDGIIKLQIFINIKRKNMKFSLIFFTCGNI